MKSGLAETNRLCVFGSKKNGKNGNDGNGKNGNEISWFRSLK